MRKKSFKKIWLEVAEAFGEPNKTREQQVASEMGLCYAFGYYERGRARATDTKMYVYLSQFNPEDDYWFPFASQYGYEMRCLFACLFSNMTEKEFIELCS